MNFQPKNEILFTIASSRPGVAGNLALNLRLKEEYLQIDVAFQMSCPPGEENIK
jgi:hypothetical protein